MDMYSEANKKAIVKYLAKLRTITFRVKPEEYETMEKAVEKAGYKSMRQFYLDAINEKIENINKKLDI